MGHGSNVFDLYGFFQNYHIAELADFVLYQRLFFNKIRQLRFDFADLQVVQLNRLGCLITKVIINGCRNWRNWLGFKMTGASIKELDAPAYSLAKGAYLDNFCCSI